MMMHVPVVDPLIVAKALLTLNAARFSVTVSPNGSSPMAPMSVATAPSWASQQAVLAAAPPGWMVTLAGVSLA